MPAEIVERAGKPGEKGRRENSARGDDPFLGGAALAVRKFPGGLGKVVGRRFRGEFDPGERGPGRRLVVMRKRDDEAAVATPFVRNQNICFGGELLVGAVGLGVFHFPEKQIGEVQARREKRGLGLMRLRERFARRAEVSLFERNRASEIKRFATFPLLLVALLEFRESGLDVSMLVIALRGLEQIPDVRGGAERNRQTEEQEAEKDPVGRHGGRLKENPDRDKRKCARRMGRDSNPGCLAANTLSRRAH